MEIKNKLVFILLCCVSSSVFAENMVITNTMVIDGVLATPIISQITKTADTSLKIIVKPTDLFRGLLTVKGSVVEDEHNQQILQYEQGVASLSTINIGYLNSLAFSATSHITSTQASVLPLVTTDHFTVSYMLVEGNSAKFNAEASTGEVSFTVAPNETRYYFTTDVTDDVGVIKTYTVNLNIDFGTNTPDTTAPIFTSSTTMRIDDNQIAAITLVTTDQSVVNYAIRDRDSDDFDIDVTTGMVSFKVAPDASQQNYYFTAVATDSSGNSSQQKVQIRVDDKTAPSFSSPVTVTMNEGEIDVLTLVATDLGSSGVTYTISDGDSADFALDFNSGEIVFKVAPDFEIKNQYSFTAIARDRYNNIATQEIIVTIDDIIDTTAPVFTSPTLIGVDENQRLAVQLIATDNHTVSYSMEGGASHLFSIDARTGIILFKVAPNYEQGVLDYSFTAIATDGENNMVTQEMTVSINDVNEVGISHIPTAVTEKIARRFLTQATFGAMTESIEALQMKGIVQWLDDQLNTVSAYDDLGDDYLSHFERYIQLAKEANNPVYLSGYEQYINHEVKVEQDSSYRGIDLIPAIWYEMALSKPDQIRHRMAYALGQIVVVSNPADIFRENPEAVSYSADILAKHALGNYKELLNEVAISAPMGVFLTHNGNKKANVDLGTAPDENFARELTQLFTIGLYELNLDGSPKLDGNSELIPTYTQEDVEELARVMTGWDQVDNTDRYGHEDGRFNRPMKFTAEHHDFGEKIFLGQTIPANLTGHEDMQAAIDILYEHSNMAPFISELLIQRFTTSNPSPEYIARVATVFNDNGFSEKGDLKAVVRAILLDQDIFDATKSKHFKKIKEPVLALTQFYRAFDFTPRPTIESRWENPISHVYWLRFRRNLLGQIPFRSPTVFNFYSPSYVMADSYFKANNLATPEMELLTPQRILLMSNYFSHLLKHEKNRIAVWGFSGIFSSNTMRGDSSIIFDFTRELNIIEQVLDGDINGDFLNIKDHTKLRPALVVLVDHLDNVLTNGSMTESHKNDIVDVIINGQITLTVARVKEKVFSNIIYPAVRAILLTDAYMVQK